MRNTDKVTLTTVMTINFDDFRDLVQEVCGNVYDVEDDYGDIRFFHIDDDGEEIEDNDTDIAEEYVREKLEEYFEVIICSFRLIIEYTGREVMIPYIDN